MRIAYITNCFGTQSHTFIRREVIELSKLGVEVELFGIRREDSPQLSEAEHELVERTRYLYPLGVLEVVRANLHCFFDRPVNYLRSLGIALGNSERKISAHMKVVYHFLVAASLAREVERCSAEHLHAHFLNVSASVALFASLLSGVPYSVTVHSAGTKNAPHIIAIKEKLRHARSLVMISHYNVEYFDAIEACREKSQVIRCGMDLESYLFIRREEGARLARGSSAIAAGRVFRIVAVGRMVEKKGFSYLLDAAKALRGEHQFEVSILGSGPLESALKAQAVRLELGDRVRFLGQRSSAEVRESMEKADCVVVPSVTSTSGEMEGLPVVIMEAMAVGTPVVATAHSAIPELVINEETGLLVPEKDAAALAIALARLIDGSVDSARLTKNARERVEAEFDVALVAQQRKAFFGAAVGGTS